MRILPTHNTRLFVLQLLFTGLLIVLALLTEIRKVGPLMRLSAESTYSSAPTYGVIQLESNEAVRRLHPSAAVKKPSAKDRRLKRIQNRQSTR